MLCSLCSVRDRYLWDSEASLWNVLVLFWHPKLHPISNRLSPDREATDSNAKVGGNWGSIRWKMGLNHGVFIDIWTSWFSVKSLKLCKENLNKLGDTINWHLFFSSLPDQVVLGCANPTCWFLASPNDEDGGYCCKKCHWRHVPRFWIIEMGISTWMIQLLGFEMIHLSRPIIRIDGSLQTFQSPNFSCRKLVSFLSLPCFWEEELVRRYHRYKSKWRTLGRIWLHVFNVI